MKKAFLLLFLPVVVWAGETFGGLKKLFPDRAIDFYIEKKSYAETDRGAIPLKDYSIEKVGENLYRLKMLFYSPPKVKRHKVFSGVYINTVVRGEVSLTAETLFWYRGGRFIAFKGISGIKTFDLQPKCYFLQKGDRLIPTYSSGDVVFTSPNGVKVHLFLTFERCGF